MRPFQPPRPNAAQSHHPRPGDPGPPPLHALPMHQQLNHGAFPPPGTGFAAANPMAAAAAANPFLAMQIFGQAQQLQNLAYLAAAALQQQQQQQQQLQQPFFPAGFPPNPNQFGAFPGRHTGFNGGGAFRPGGAGLAGPRPPLPLMGAALNGCNGNGGGSGVGTGSPKPMLNVDGKDWSSGRTGGQVNHTNNKSDGITHVVSENGESKNTSDQKSRFNPGRDGRDGRQFGPSGGRGRDGRGGRQFGPSGGRGRGDGRGGRQFGPSGGRGRGDGPSGGRGRGDGPSGGRGRGRHFNQGRGRGSNDWREGKSNFAGSDSPTSGRCHIDSPTSGGGRKRPPICYDTNEVKQWVEARKKNYPTSVNVNKKLSQSQSDDQKKDEEAQMRRLELKEVLAKQKELGFELPELPPGYLSETEGQPKGPQGNDKESKWKTQQRDCRFGNRGRGNKRQRYDRADFQSKRPREWNNSRHDGGAVAKREPTLLQKLLSSDIKRDRHRLLHTFKFMALNNFFRNLPDKPLEFPSVKVNQVELESDIAAEDLNDLVDAEKPKDISLDLKENSDQQDSSSSDGESGSKDDNEDDNEGANTEMSDKVADEDCDSDQCNVSEEEFSA